LPQYRDANRFGAWRQFESYTNESLAASGNQLYIMAGGVGYGYEPRQSGYPYKTVFNNVLVKDGIVQTDSNNRPELANSLPKDSNGDPKEGYSLQPVENEKLIYVPEYLWKIALVVKRGKTLADIDSQTKAIAIITPNRSQLKSSGTIALPNGVEKNIQNWNDWQEWQVSVDYLEEITGLDFFSELPDAIEQAVERRNPYSAALQAESDQSLLREIGVGVSDNFSIRPDSLIPDTLHKISILENSSPEISSIYGGESEASILEIALLKDRFNKDGFLEYGSLQVGIAQISSHQISKSEVSTTKDSSFKVGTTQIGAAQIDPTQINSLQIGTRNSGSWFESGIREISLPSSITLQQFLSSHNFNLQNTTIPTWTEFLTGTTPFNLKIEITDLPTGQLAEANITHFDSNGRPTSGTLTHLFHRRFANDTDANGLGWF
jgi:DNA/RNA non-specific endonuclease